MFVVFMLSAAMMIYGFRRYQDLSREIKARTAAELDTRNLARHDPLTGLPNRRFFEEKLEEYLGDASATQQVAVLMLDLDGFKTVNDTHGHEGGDNVLLGVASLLQKFARRSDFVGRWGGEEFVVGLAHTGQAVARTPAERLRASVEGHRFRLPGGVDVHVTASIGIATAARGEPVDQLIARADRAMYLAKSQGRNQCQQDDPCAPVPP